MTLQEYALKIERALEEKKVSLKEKHNQLLKEREDAYATYRETEKTDRSENAPLEEAIKKIKLNNSAIITNSKSLSKMQDIPDLRRYNSTGMVLMYSTVRLECEGKEYIFRIYPEGVSFIDICSEYDGNGALIRHVGAIAADSRLAIALMKKTVGEIIPIIHKADSSRVLNYVIKEIY